MRSEAGLRESNTYSADESLRDVFNQNATRWDSGLHPLSVLV
jgi:hypothetical protein